ncbi:hypothetical protein [Nocardioides stalactiti]|uniref:hypothetical protein n=1 Tax=Nocardioides stalactiti TaxID=2755356 RepID=UPI001602EB02|nr:hypothetical protein [Nocardioides stalactiti]
MRSARSRAERLLVLMAASVLGAGLAAAPSQAAEGDPVITWPEVTVFDPANVTYEIGTQYDGPDFLFLQASPAGATDASLRPLPREGTTTITFDGDYDGQVGLGVLRCPVDDPRSYRCTRVGSYHYLGVYDEVVATVQGRALRGPGNPFLVEAAPAGDHGFDIDWEVVPAGQPDSTPLVSGSAHAEAGWRFELALPEIGQSGALVHGQRYRLLMTIRSEGEYIGSVEGAAATEFEWDGENATRNVRFLVSDQVLGETFNDPEVFYPAVDPTVEWRDDVRFQVLKDEPEVMKETVVTVTDEAGELVVSRTFSTAGGQWDGRGSDGRIVPAGWYDLEVTVVDKQGNEATFTHQIRVSLERLAQVRKEIPLSPRRTLTHKYVGRCASVESPARAAWSGSIALRSTRTGSRCKDPRDQFVQTVHGFYLPWSPVQKRENFDLIRVWTYGGAARPASLLHLYWMRSEKWAGYKRFDNEQGWNPGFQVGSNVVHWDSEAQRYFVLWTLVLDKGERYDVKEFRFAVRYWKLLPPRS